MHPPVFVLAPPRSFTSVVTAMLGQHPQMYALPETNLFLTDSLDEWWSAHQSDQWGFGLSGLRRAIAELYFEDQSEEAVRQATAWILRRRSWPTAFLFSELMERVHPSILVEKSPTAALHPASMRRAVRHFPRSRFIHLLRDPSTQRRSTQAFIDMNDGRGPLHRQVSLDAAAGTEWYVAHSNIRRFLGSLPRSQAFQLRGEDVLADPETQLRATVQWLGLRADDEAIEQMKHPERSPFACFGPPSARFGNDPFFLMRPRLDSGRPRSQRRRTLSSGILQQIPLPHRVQRLAKELGYA
jgi:Sulfotransferase family